MGGWLVQTADDLQRRLPHQPAKMQIRAATIPSERVPLRNRLSIPAGRGEGLASGNHNQTDPARHPRPPERAQHQGSRPG